MRTSFEAIWAFIDAGLKPADIAEALAGEFDVFEAANAMQRHGEFALEDIAKAIREGCGLSDKDIAQVMRSPEGCYFEE